MRWGLTAWGERTHDVCSAIGKTKVIGVDLPDTFRDVELLLTPEDTAIGNCLTP